MHVVEWRITGTRPEGSCSHVIVPLVLLVVIARHTELWLPENQTHTQCHECPLMECFAATGEYMCGTVLSCTAV